MSSACRTSDHLSALAFKPSACVQAEMVAIELEAAEAAEVAALQGGEPLPGTVEGEASESEGGAGARRWLVGFGVHAAIGDLSVHGYRLVGIACCHFFALV